MVSVSACVLNLIHFKIMTLRVHAKCLYIHAKWSSSLFVFVPGNVYYYHEKTGESTWSKPTDMVSLHTSGGGWGFINPLHPMSAIKETDEGGVTANPQAMHESSLVLSPTRAGASAEGFEFGDSTVDGTDYGVDDEAAGAAAAAEAAKAAAEAGEAGGWGEGNWIPHIDPATGHEYWCNDVTGVSSWEKPQVKGTTTAMDMYTSKAPARNAAFAAIAKREAACAAKLKSAELAIDAMNTSKSMKNLLKMKAKKSIEEELAREGSLPGETGEWEVN